MQYNKTLIEKAVKFLNNKKPIHSLVNDFNLNIHFYLSTSFFETIILNKPSILILKTGIIDELDNQFLKDLRILKKYHICFEDSAKAAKFVKNNYLNLDKWWNDESTQAARKNFYSIL